LREVHVVNSLHEVLRSDALATEETAVEALDGILAALDTVKLDVDLSISGTGSNTDVHNLPVVAVAFFLDVFLELLVPSGLLGANAESQFVIFAVVVEDLTYSFSVYKFLSRTHRLGAASSTGAFFCWAFGVAFGSVSSVLASLRISASRE